MAIVDVNFICVCVLYAATGAVVWNVCTLVQMRNLMIIWWWFNVIWFDLNVCADQLAEV